MNPVISRLMKPLLLLIAAAAFLSSCNTTIGLGRDLRILGEEMEKKSAQRKGGGQPAEQNYGGPVY
jgi:predicted small secreted protein